MYKIFILLIFIQILFTNNIIRFAYSGLTIANLTTAGMADAYMCKDIPDSIKNNILWHWWSIKNKHIIWLGANNLILPIARCYTATDYIRNLEKKQFLFNTCGSYLIGSVCWDLIFKKMTVGKWIERENWWAIVGPIRISFTKKQYLIFHTLRIVFGCYLIYYSFNI